MRVDAIESLVFLKHLEANLDAALRHAFHSLRDEGVHALLKHLGHEVGRDKVKSDLAWLAEQELVTVEEIEEITVATLTGRGVDVAAGSVIVPGVKRPRPGK